MWTLLSVPREDCPLSARVRSDDAAVGPLLNTAHESAWCRGTSCKSSEIWKVSVGPGWLNFFGWLPFWESCYFFFEKLLFGFFFWVFSRQVVDGVFFSRKVVRMLLVGFFFAGGVLRRMLLVGAPFCQVVLMLLEGVWALCGCCR